MTTAPPQAATSLADWPARALASAFASGDCSPVDATQAALARISAWEPTLNAMYLVKAEQALAAARASEARWQRREPLSPLDGVPITLKENLYTAGDPAPIGSASVMAIDPAPKKADSPVAARVREGGLVLLGKTTMPDYGMLSSGRSSFHGTTRSPWRVAGRAEFDRNPAGSSSGAGAAGAAGYGPLHMGTDIGGSVRLPAAQCGLFGLKPSLGRIPIHPPYMGRVAGPLTRTVADAAALMNLITQPDARDYRSLPATAADYTAMRPMDWLKGLRIGLLDDMQVGWPVEPQVKAAVRAAAAALEKAGATVVPVRPFITEAQLVGVSAFWEARAWADLSRMPEAVRNLSLPFINEWARHRAQGFDGTAVMDGYNAIQAMREATVGALFADGTPLDFLLSPTSPVTAYHAELHCPGDDPHKALHHIAFTAPFNMSEQPAASLNWAHTSDGLPIGIQVAGQRFDDQGVLQLCGLLEQLRPVQAAWPSLPC
jgi:Asp-tRNA(Asn)/Glu-tRNA(Gln) amidotransferase A subunit family amidase